MLYNIKSQQIKGLTKSSFEITTGCSQNKNLLIQTENLLIFKKINTHESHSPCRRYMDPDSSQSQ